MMAYDENTKTEFNSAIASLERLNVALRLCMDSSMEENIFVWRLALEQVYKEIVVKLSKTEEETTNKLRKEIEDEYLRINKIASHEGINILYVETKLYSLLPRYEVHLRKLADKHGLLNPDKGTIFDE